MNMFPAMQNLHRQGIGKWERELATGDVNGGWITGDVNADTVLAYLASY